jgi:hypothetical protein
MKAEEFYSTKVLLQLVRILGEKQAKINEILLKSRAKHLREYTQSKIMETKKIDPLIKPYLDSTMLIFKEFNDLGIPKEDCVEWLYDRYSEVRKLIKAVLKPANQSAKTKTSKPDNLGIDTLQTLDQLVRNCTLNLQSAADPEVLVDLCIGDILAEHLFTKVPLCASQMIAIVKQKGNAMFPDEQLNTYLGNLRTKISEVVSLEQQSARFIESVVEEFISKHMIDFFCNQLVPAVNDSLFIETYIDAVIDFVDS